ncbi:MAG: hypothetical protein K6G70_04765 [Bacteroidaceae bacterium]|nr:hypothetical protein [Bacteroidaceae bacterium]
MKKYIIPKTAVMEMAENLPIALSMKMDRSTTIETGDILVKENLVDEDFWDSPFEE